MCSTMKKTNEDDNGMSKGGSWICLFGDFLLCTVVNHHFSPPFGEYFLELSPSILKKSKVLNVAHLKDDLNSIATRWV